MDTRKFLYKESISKQSLDLLEKMIFNPFQIFEMKKNEIDTESIDDVLWTRFWGTSNLKKAPNYFEKFTCLKQELRTVFLLLSYILFCKQGLKVFLDSKLFMLKGTCTYSKKSNHSRLLYILLKYSQCKHVYEKQGKESFYINFEDALRTPSFGICLKELLQARISYTYSKPIDSIQDIEFYGLCKELHFAEALGLDYEIFMQWLNGDLYGEYINKTRIQNFICIQDVLFEFENSKEIYLLGENGDGKTLLLDALFLTYSMNRVREITDKGIESVNKILADINKQKSFLFGSDNIMSVYGTDFPSDLHNIYAYGTHRGRIDSIDGKDADKQGFLTLFNPNLTLINPSIWLKEFCCNEAMELFDSSDANLQDAFSEVQTKIEVKRKDIQSILNTLLVGKNIEIIIDKTSNYSVKYREKGAILDFEQLSEGFRTTIIFVCDLLYRLSRGDVGRDARDIMNSKAVVFIDEIDAHLHPRWQVTIVNSLRQLFPNIQFIMTTHSPHIIQGASQDALIYKVYRNEEGKTCVSEPYYRSKLNNMMINTLATSPLFNLDDARMCSEDGNADTSNSYLTSRIEQLVREEIAQSKMTSYLTPQKIDELILKAKEKALSKSRE